MGGPLKHYIISVFRPPLYFSNQYVGPVKIHSILLSYDLSLHLRQKKTKLTFFHDAQDRQCSQVRNLCWYFRLSDSGHLITLNHYITLYTLCNCDDGRVKHFMVSTWHLLVCLSIGTSTTPYRLQLNHVVPVRYSIDRTTKPLGTSATSYRPYN